MDSPRWAGVELRIVFLEALNTPAALGFEMLFGSGLMLSATALGWAVGRRRNWLPVRAMWWWMHAVVLPLLSCRSWLQRALIIFANNGMVLAAVVGSGLWISTSIGAISLVGLALGIALRSLSELSPHWSPPSPNCAADVRRRVRVGVSLNLLELPAISLAIALSLGQADGSLQPTAVWGTFALWVVPLLLAAASGESLWLGVGLPATSSPMTGLDPARSETRTANLSGKIN